MPSGRAYDDPGWVRIGTPVDVEGRPPVTEDKLTRRSLWFRLNLKAGAVSRNATDEWVFHAGPNADPYPFSFIESVELCAGREGDDGYVKIEAAQLPTREMHALIDVLLVAEEAVMVEEDIDE